jgi:hypothetical protein
LNDAVIMTFLKETAHNCDIIVLPKGDKNSKFGGVRRMPIGKDSHDRVQWLQAG